MRVKKKNMFWCISLLTTIKREKKRGKKITNTGWNEIIKYLEQDIECSFKITAFKYARRSNNGYSCLNFKQTFFYTPVHPQSICSHIRHLIVILNSPPPPFLFGNVVWESLESQNFRVIWKLSSCFYTCLWRHLKSFDGCLIWIL